MTKQAAKFEHKPYGPYERWVKRPLDFTLALLAFIVLLPLLVVLTVTGAIAMKGNPFFVQKRPGRIRKETGQEKIFSLIKFRTMSNAKNKDGKLLPDEKRLNRYGRFLRSTSLDELPELLNIIIGDLSIVGPRPLMARYLPYYDENERRRHLVRPGLTGYAQIHGRNAVNWEYRFQLDCYYVDNISFVLDVKILFKTIKAVLLHDALAIDDPIAFDVYKMKKSETRYAMLQTPYYLIDEISMNSLIDDMLAALHARWSKGIVGYSLKTNNLPWIISHMKEKGLWAEVVSSDEYHLARNLGFEASNIIFNGPVKGKEEFIDAIENGAIINIDSKRELYWLKDYRQSVKKSKIGLRVNFCLEDFCPGESQCGREDGRFGFSYECGELKDALHYLQEIGIKISGLHLHCSSKTRSLNIYRAIAEITQKIVNEYQLDLQYVDIGGGFFGGMPEKPIFDDYFDVIYGIFSKDPLLKKVNLIVEPGMSVIGSSVRYVTTVIDVKQTKNNRFVFLDGSRIHVDPLMKKSAYSYEIERSKRSVDDTSCEQIICGFTCMETDRFFTLDAPALQQEDKVIFNRVGAYTMGLLPQFISFYPSVAVEQNGGVKIVRHKNEAEDFLKINV